MEYLILWIMGIILLIITRFVVNHSTHMERIHILGEYDNIYFYNDDCSKLKMIILDALAVISTGIVIGIPNGILFNIPTEFLKKPGAIIAQIFILPLFIALCYHIFFPKGFYLIRVSIITFLVATIFFGIVFKAYSNKYVEKTAENTIISTQDRELLYFGNTPLQNISGKFRLGNGEISTANELPYWYIDANNDARYGSVNPDQSKIIFISGKEKPYLNIAKYQKVIKVVDKHTGIKASVNGDVWVEYIFYLPEKNMQYSLEN